MEFDYFRYLARTMPPADLARAVRIRLMRRVRAKVRSSLPQALLATLSDPAPGRPRLMRRAVVTPAQREETAALLRALHPAACAAVLDEAQAALRGELMVFGSRVGCALEPASTPGAPAPLDFHLDPVGQVRYPREQRGPQVDLFQSGADAKAAWEVGRLSHLWRYAQARWLAPTPEERSHWARAWVLTVRQFARECPPGRGVQWSVAMEAALRATNLCLSFALVQDDPEIGFGFLEELCELLQAHGMFIEENLEDEGVVRNNHYAADLVGLAVISSLFPELPSARRWKKTALPLLWGEIAQQVRADGTHFESSTGYQRLCAEMFLAAVVAVRAARSPVPTEVISALAGLFRSSTELLKPSGRLAQIGDFDSCRALPLSPREALDGSYLPGLGAAALGDGTLKRENEECPPEALWLLGPLAASRLASLPAKARKGSLLLREAGLALLRQGDAWLCLSSGPNGQGGCGGHGHNDKNGLELSFGPHDVFIDRGTYVYARDAADRDARRGTAGHSTLQLDEEEQNPIYPNRLFALPDVTRARIVSLEEQGGEATAVGTHEGYRRLFGNPVHERTVKLLAAARAALIVDRIDGLGRHRLDLRFILPGTEVRVREATAEEAQRLAALASRAGSRSFDTAACVELSAEGQPVAVCAFASSIHYQMTVESTTVSPGYGELRPGTILRLTALDELPGHFSTAVLSVGESKIF